MDMLDRIAAVLRAIFGDAGSGARTGDSDAGVGASEGFSARPADPDLAAAWDELNDYLGSDGRDAGRANSRTGARHPLQPPEALRRDYANLEVPFGADIDTVRQSYKRLVLRYHPDRHAGNAEKARVATEITKKVNESFERIRSWQEHGAAGKR